ncbi:hypothetical protein V5799_000120 [Amblyomma americanum]|uniref:Uncharacterized protein n=1 Tax=Amblyomma americanum TaxID=6943 RepID=A0AAQ4D3Z5_AMBAM
MWHKREEEGTIKGKITMLVMTLKAHWQKVRPQICTRRRRGCYLTSTNTEEKRTGRQKKTAAIGRGFLRSNGAGSAHRHAGERQRRSTANTATATERRRGDRIRTHTPLSKRLRLRRRLPDQVQHTNTTARSRMSACPTRKQIYCPFPRTRACLSGDAPRTS